MKYRIMVLNNLYKNSFYPLVQKMEPRDSEAWRRGEGRGEKLERRENKTGNQMLFLSPWVNLTDQHASPLT